MLMSHSLANIQLGCYPLCKMKQVHSFHQYSHALLCLINGKIAQILKTCFKINAFNIKNKTKSYFNYNIFYFYKNNPNKDGE